MDTQVKYGLRPACFAGFNRAGNAAKLQMDKQGIAYKTKDNAFTYVQNPEKLQEIVQNLTGRSIQNRVEHWKDIFFKFNKGNTPQDQNTSSINGMRHKSKYLPI